MMKKPITYFLILSLIANITLGILIFKIMKNQEPAALANSEIKSAGTFGPKSIEVVEGDLTIKAADVSLQNTRITGNLYLTKEIGDGSVNLLNVIVEGTTYVNGGGENSVYFENTTLHELKIKKEQGIVRVVVRAKTDITSTSVESSAALAAESLREDALGFGVITINTTERVNLFGHYKDLLFDKEVHVSLEQGSIGKLHITADGVNSSINISSGAAIETLLIEGKTEVTGEGKIVTVTINAPGLTKLAGIIKEIKTKGKGIFVEISKGSVEKLTVEETETATAIHLTVESSVMSLILMGKTAVTGTGKIESVVIKSPGTTIEQTPGKVVLDKNVTAVIGGKEQTFVEEVQPTQPTTPSQPSAPNQYVTPTVTLSSINNMTLGLGQSGSTNISVTSGAKVTVSSSNGNVSATLNGNSITLYANSPGSAQITVRAEKSGYYSKTQTFTVTVNLVKSFNVYDGISTGKKLVTVVLWGPNPGAHSVSVGGIGLAYDPGLGVFSGEVNASLANISNLVVQ